MQKIVSATYFWKLFIYFDPQSTGTAKLKFLHFNHFQELENKMKDKKPKYIFGNIFSQNPPVPALDVIGCERLAGPAAWPPAAWSGRRGRCTTGPRSSLCQSPPSTPEDFKKSIRHWRRKTCLKKEPASESVIAKYDLPVADTNYKQ